MGYRCPRPGETLADQLTPQQVAELEYCEREGIPPGMAEPKYQLNCAREVARYNFIQELCADIAPPADALGHWRPATRRNYRGAARGFFAWAYRGDRTRDCLGDHLPSVCDSPPLPRPVPDTVWRDALAAKHLIMLDTPG
jgi:hypothetical protein